MQHVKDRDVVLSAAPMIYFLSRLEFIDYVMPLFNFYVGFVFQTPVSDELTGGAFIKPFSATLWTAIIVLIWITALFLKCHFHVELRLASETSPFEPSFVSTLVQSFGSLCQQGSSVFPTRNSSRIVSLSMLLASLVLYNYYTSLAVSDLISFPKKTRVNSLSALADSSMKIVAENTSYLQYVFKVCE